MVVARWYMDRYYVDTYYKEHHPVFMYRGLMQQKLVRHLKIRSHHYKVAGKFFEENLDKGIPWFTFE